MLAVLIESVDTLNCKEKAERQRDGRKESADRQERTIGVRGCIPTNKQSDVGEAHGGWRRQPWRREGPG